MWKWFNTVIAANTFSENAAHILAGYAAVMTVAFFRVLHETLPIVPWHWYAGFAVLAALKEYAYDAHFENPHQTFLMNTTDFLGYVVGIAFGVGVASRA